jgi:hypothetical protein
VASGYRDGQLKPDQMSGASAKIHERRGFTGTARESLASNRHPSAAPPPSLLPSSSSDSLRPCGGNKLSRSYIGLRLVLLDPSFARSKTGKVCLDSLLKQELKDQGGRGSRMGVDGLRDYKLSLARGMASLLTCMRLQVQEKMGKTDDRRVDRMDYVGARQSPTHGASFAVLYSFT